mgnify:CR=1 FL=1
MKDLLKLVDTLEVPLYLLLLGIMFLKTNIALAVFLFVVSLFRLYTNINFKNNI